MQNIIETTRFGGNKEGVKGFHYFSSIQDESMGATKNSVRLKYLFHMGKLMAWKPM
jgi:hypothetical protein